MCDKRLVIADRLRAAAEFRRSGELFDALRLINYARNVRLIGRDSGVWHGPGALKVERLSVSLWRRHCRHGGVNV